MKLESGPAKTDAIWQLVRTVLFLGFAAWFLYDGAYYWPHQNQVKAKEKLATPGLFDGQLTYAELPEKPGKAEHDALLAARPDSPARVREILGGGEPQLTKQDRGELAEYYVSQWGYVIVPYRAGQPLINQSTWQAWYKTQDDIRLQFVLAVVACLPGLYFLWKLYKAATLRVVLDDAGMNYGGKRINYDQMVALRDYNPKGWIDLFYSHGKDQKRLRLDNEKVMRFEDIVAAICEVKGFENEVAAFHEQQAREASEPDLDEGAPEDAVEDEGAEDTGGDQQDRS